MDNLLNKAHVYSAAKLLDPNVKISKEWMVAFNNFARRVIATNVKANMDAKRVIMKSFVAAAAKQATGEEASVQVAEQTDTKGITMRPWGGQQRSITVAYTAIIDTKATIGLDNDNPHRCAIAGSLAVHTSLKDGVLDAMLERLIARKLNAVGIEATDIKIMDKKDG